MRYAVAFPASALLLGTMAGVHLRLPSWAWMALLCVGWIALGASLCVTRGRPSHAGSIVLCAGCLGFFGAGATLAAVDAAGARRPSLLTELARLDRDPTTCGYAPSPDDCAPVIEVEGRLREDASRGDFGVSFTLDVARFYPPSPASEPNEVTAVPVDGAIRVTVGGASATEAMSGWRAGRVIRAPIVVRAPLPYRNFGLPDQRERLALAGFTLFGSLKSASLLTLVAHAPWWQERAADARAWIRTRIARHVDETLSAAIVTAVLIGDRAALRAEDEEQLQRAGTYHVIAISGGNIAILTGTLLWLLRSLPIPARMRPICAAALVCAYGLIVEDGESVRRATWAAVGYLLARAMDLEARSLNVFACVVGMMLVLTPLSVVSAAFWLTCGATLGILLHAVPLLARWTTRDRPLQTRVIWAIAGMTVMTIAAEVMVLPVTAHAFSLVTAAGLLLNLLAIPLMTIAQLSGMAMLAVSAIADLASALSLPHGLTAAAALAADITGSLANVAATYLLRSASLVSYAPWLAWRVPPPPVWLLLAYFACWACIWTLPRIHRHARVAAAACWTTCLLLMVLAPPLPSVSLPAELLSASPTPDTYACDAEAIPPDWNRRAWLRVTMLDVGQGSATLLEAPAIDPLLIDAGGSSSSSFDIGARIVSPSLWALGLRRLSAFAITHGDIDHAGGAPAIIRDFTPRLLLASSSQNAQDDDPPSDPRLSRVVELTRVHGIRWQNLSAPDTIRIGEATAFTRHPARIVQPGKTDEPSPARGDVIDLQSSSGSSSGLSLSSSPTSMRAQSPGSRLSTSTSTPTPPSPHRLTNDESLVLEVRLGAVSIVLPGDISGAVERRIAHAFDRSPFAILAAPHHGSASSSSPALLDTLSPRIALISAGLGNRHGHPSRLVLNRFRDRGATVFRTDLDGAIQLLTDGHLIHIRTCTGRRLRVAAAGLPM